MGNQHLLYVLDIGLGEVHKSLTFRRNGQAGCNQVPFSSQQVAKQLFKWAY